MKRQLEVGDVIVCNGEKVIIAGIKYQEPWEWRKSWYLEFKGIDGEYRSWNQFFDGGYALDSTGKSI